MRGIAGLPVVDHHAHLSPAGEGVRAAQRFRDGGGTHLFLATQNYTATPPSSLEDYRQQFETTERLAFAVREATGVVVYIVIAPYPIDLIAASARVGLPAAVEVQRAVLDLAGRWVRERRAVALGEVGWPHFKVAPEIEDAAHRVFRHALAVARDSSCPVVVHSPDLDTAGWQALEDEARQAGLPPGRVVKHYTRARHARAGEGPVPSYLARRPLVAEVLADPGPWFLETDFLDDRARPGAVLDLETVPRRASEIARRGADAVERLAVPFVRSVKDVYDLTVELPER